MRPYNSAGPLARQLTQLNQVTTKLARQQMGEKHKIYPAPKQPARRKRK